MWMIIITEEEKMERRVLMCTWIGFELDLSRFEVIKYNDLFLDRF